MKQRHPNQKSTYESWVGRRKTTPKEEGIVVRQADLDALKAIQEARPAKPPGRR